MPTWFLRLWWIAPTLLLSVFVCGATRILCETVAEGVYDENAVRKLVGAVLSLIAAFGITALCLVAGRSKTKKH